jgi:hypothetical protein
MKETKAETTSNGFRMGAILRQLDTQGNSGKVPQLGKSKQYSCTSLMGCALQYDFEDPRALLLARKSAAVCCRTGGSSDANPALISGYLLCLQQLSPDG